MIVRKGEGYSAYLRVFFYFIDCERRVFLRASRCTSISVSEALSPSFFIWNSNDLVTEPFRTASENSWKYSRLSNRPPLKPRVERLFSYYFTMKGKRIVVRLVLRRHPRWQILPETFSYVPVLTVNKLTKIEKGNSKIVRSRLSFRMFLTHLTMKPTFLSIIDINETYLEKTWIQVGFLASVASNRIHFYLTSM